MRPEYRFDFCIASFCVLEQQLKSCMEYIPFIETNKQVLSPKFVPVIFEACSLVDSIFTEMAGDATERYNLKRHNQKHEPYLLLAEKTTLFLISPMQVLQPYREWSTTQPEWWAAYNALKHDRLDNYEVATYTNAVLALCALHQVMASFKEFIGGFLRAGWIATESFDVLTDLGSAAHLGGLHPGPPSVVIQSELFASPTRENFIGYHTDDPRFFEVDYDARGLSHRIRDLLFAHDDW